MDTGIVLLGLVGLWSVVFTIAVIVGADRGDVNEEFCIPQRSEDKRKTRN